MELQGNYFASNFGMMMDFAFSQAREAGKPYGIDFKSINADNIQLSMSNGKVEHIWLHTQHNGLSVRCAITNTETALYAWKDGKGWMPYKPAKLHKPEKDMMGFERTGKRVFCTTHGWDGKDYEGAGRYFPEWKYTGELASEDVNECSFIRIYKHKAWCFLKVTNRKSAAGAPEAEFYTHRDA